MSRRGASHREACQHAGCKESGWYEFDTQREYREYLERRRGKPWFCTRHTRPDEVLSSDNPECTTVLVATELSSDLTGNPLGRFWIAEGLTTGSGFTYGPGFKAYAEDFPEGTRLVVTARIEAGS